ncbi:MAG TPA: cyclase family protein, partial [Pirellulales bacterium]|jgi:kynurenine formamidase|nr:cyclase family protein [Pirellulales bacterium]
LSPQTPAFPGDASLEITVVDSATKPSTSGERHLNSSRLSMSLHCGTHMDAPFHFFQQLATIDQVALERCIGPTALVRLATSVRAGSIERSHLEPYAALLRSTRRVVLDTGWHHRWGAEDYFTAHPVIVGEAARFLVECGVTLVGVDTPSVDRPPFDAHLELLGAGLLIVENLTNLQAIPGDVFDLVAVPLAIAGRDGSPVRALAIV